MTGQFGICSDNHIFNLILKLSGDIQEKNQFVYFSGIKFELDISFELSNKLLMH